jgi:hypothetical protein
MRTPMTNSFARTTLKDFSSKRNMKITGKTSAMARGPFVRKAKARNRKER